jgi:hypothetical protein
MANRAIIPLYINSELLNNLFTVVIQEFIQVKSISTKDVITVNLSAPISEFSYDLLGKYAQGDLQLVLQNEYVKQRTEEQISTVIVVLTKLRSILGEQSMIKYITDSTVLDNVKENDFIEFTTVLSPNPVLKRVRDIVEDFEINNLFSIKKKDDEAPNKLGFDKERIASFLRGGLDRCRNERCIRYMARPLVDSSHIIIVPIKNSCMLDNEDYLLNGRVTILGKVVRVIKDPDSDEIAASSKDNKISWGSRDRFISNTLFDNMDLDLIEGIMGKNASSRKPAASSEEVNVDDVHTVIEIIPISISI